MLSFFISGLKPEIKRELLFAQPQSLLQAMALARLQEDKLNEMKQFLKFSGQKSMSDCMPNKVQSVSQPILSKPAFNTTPLQSKNPLLPIKRLTSTRLKVRREKGLCYNCDDKFALDHKCRRMAIGQGGDGWGRRLVSPSPIPAPIPSGDFVIPSNRDWGSPP